MAVDDDTVARARGYQRRALEDLLASAYPAVHRMALGLSGREDVGRGITRFVMNQAVPRVSRFRDADAAQRWFHHHTVLTARRAARHEPSPKEDVLARPHAKDAGQVAFIRALRSLPFQQREAFILHVGEGMNLRQLAIAMDCSTRAAELHLVAAEQALRPMAQAEYDAMVQRVHEAYVRLGPDEDTLLPSVRSAVGRSLLAWRINRLVKLIAMFIILAAVAYTAWRFREFLPWPPAGQQP